MQKHLSNPCKYRGKLLLVITAILVFSHCSKIDISSIDNAETFDLKSTQTGFNYSIHTWYPDGYSESESYHTLYLLDGDDYFEESVELLQDLGKDNIVLIGIGYSDENERSIDYSYPNDRDFPIDNGGALRFIDFINKELISEIEEGLQISSIDRTLYGHSLGGYLALYLLFQEDQPNPFQNFIAISPNLMWYDAYLLKLEEDYSEANSALDKQLYLSVGDLEGASLNLFFDAFIRQLKTHQYDDFSLQYERLEDTSHRNSPIKGLENSISSLF